MFQNQGSEGPDQGTNQGPDQGTNQEPNQGGNQGQSPDSQTTSPAGQSPQCPIGHLEGEQIALVCPTGFRRHPKYCNLFYQCTTSGNFDYKVLVMNCPNGTVYDEKAIQCLPPENAAQCSGQTAQTSLLRRLNENSLPPVSNIVKSSILFSCH